MLARAALLSLLALVFASCTFPTEESEMSFTYRAFGGDDSFDQVLEIKNDGFHAVRTHLDVTPLDSFGAPIDGLTVTSAFGSLRGQQVISAFFTDYDVLKFEGERASEVRDVRVEIRKLEQVDYPELTAAVEYQRLDDGKPVDYGETFDSIELKNPNDDDLDVKVALLAWNEPREGTPQQYDWAIPLEEDYTVPANGSKLVKLPPEFADQYVLSAEVFSVLTSHPEDAVANRSEWRVRAGRKAEP